VILDKTGKAIMGARLIRGMYMIDLDDAEVSVLAARSRNVPVSRNTWHRHLGHVGMTGLDALMAEDRVQGLVVAGSDAEGFCEDCLSGKQTRRPFDGVHEAEEEAGEREYMDLWGPSEVTGVGGKNWLYHMLDGHIAGPRVEFLARKSADETLDAFTGYKTEFEAQTGNKIKCLRVDNGGEWINDKWRAYLRSQGIVLETTTPYSSAQNGPGERGIRTTVEFGRCLLANSGLPKSFWPYAFKCAAYLQWFHPKKRTGGVTPHELYTGKKPDISHLRVFGSVAYAKVIPAPAKLTSRTVKAVMVGYNGTAGYHLWDPQARRFFTARDVVFEEGIGHWSRSPAGGDLEIAGDTHVPVDSESDSTDALPPSDTGEADAGAVVPDPELVTVMTVAPRRSGCEHAPSKALQDSCKSQANEAHAKAAGEKWAVGLPPKPKKSRANVAFTISTAVVPQNYREAMKHPEVWMAPTQKEYATLVGRETWVLVDLPPGANVVDCKWVFALKYNTEGEVIKWKARLVAKGFQQIAGLDFFETYAGVVRYESLRMVWAIAVEDPGWFMWAMDVVSAYLNSDMKETVYMRQPEGFAVPGQESKVCLMKKSLYGFMQSGRNWAEHLNASLEALGCVRSRADPTIRIRTTKLGTSIMGVYTDDIDTISTTIEAAADAQAGIKAAYDVTDVPRGATSLGMTITYDQDGGTLSISSRPYLERVLERYGMSDCNPKSTPLPVGVPIVPSKEPLTDAKREFMADKPYRKAV
jgi:transposase InsO family protein